MQLIAMHQRDKYATYIEGFHKNYRCITLWNDSDGLLVTSSAYFRHSPENRVPKYTNPFN